MVINRRNSVPVGSEALACVESESENFTLEDIY